MDGEKKEDNYVCLDAKYLRGKSSGDVLQKGRFVSTGDNIILVDGENSGEVFAVPHDGYMGSTFKQLWVSICRYNLDDDSPQQPFEKSALGLSSGQSAGYQPRPTNASRARLFLKELTG